MKEEHELLISRLCDSTDEDVWEAIDLLRGTEDPELISMLIPLLEHEQPDTRILAAMCLSKLKANEEALVPLLEALARPENKNCAGEMAMALQGFDVSTQYVALFKLYLFGGFKVSRVAQNLLDYEEFDITPRVLKKAEKHWHHYKHNVKHDDAFTQVEKEVEERLGDIRAYLGS